ncbi:hypothetical protein Ahy_A02g009820 [Arachis hypogaea]|uniref:Uncharacterized protein n=1 Tax=Arachis hypogaea TaxID=3818 RepID=A0A445EI92_ARAHY|nr:hypothetical protein Ahy_A02g009820 [Arachis hypogaea]
MAGVTKEEVRIVASSYRICPLGAHIDHQEILKSKFGSGVSHHKKARDYLLASELSELVKCETLSHVSINAFLDADWSLIEKTED